MPELKSTTRFGTLSSIFESHSKDMLPAIVARLAVLYEDLRIELLAVSTLDIPVLDVTDKEYRRNYFLRRSIATLWEFAEGFRQLNGCSEFSRIKLTFDAKSLSQWEKTIAFFDKFEDTLKRIRNDLGGHFGTPAARYAVEHLQPSTVGKLHVAVESPGTAGYHLHFAGEIAATALGRHLPGGTSPEKLRYLFEVILVDGYKHAVWSMEPIAYYYLWQRFGR